MQRANLANLFSCLDADCRWDILFLQEVSSPEVLEPSIALPNHDVNLETSDPLKLDEIEGHIVLYGLHPWRCSAIALNKRHKNLLVKTCFSEFPTIIVEGPSGPLACTSAYLPQIAHGSLEYMEACNRLHEVVSPFASTCRLFLGMDANSQLKAHSCPAVGPFTSCQEDSDRSLVLQAFASSLGLGFLNTLKLVNPVHDINTLYPWNGSPPRQIDFVLGPLSSQVEPAHVMPAPCSSDHTAILVPVILACQGNKRAKAMRPPKFWYLPVSDGDDSLEMLRKSSTLTSLANSTMALLLIPCRLLPSLLAMQRLSTRSRWPMVD